MSVQDSLAALQEHGTNWRVFVHRDTVLKQSCQSDVSRLVGEARGAMGDSRLVLRRLGDPGDLGWVVMAHGELYAEEFGWDASFEALVARIVADYAGEHDPAREMAWIAELDGRRVGCVFCIAADHRTAQLRILLVDPSVRGRGLGGRLVDECVAFAQAAGYHRMKLWTNHPLVAARHVYLSRGFRLVEEEAHHSFGVDLIGQSYELDLARCS